MHIILVTRTHTYAHSLVSTDAYHFCYSYTLLRPHAVRNNFFRITQVYIILYIPTMNEEVLQDPITFEWLQTPLRVLTCCGQTLNHCTLMKLFALAPKSNTFNCPLCRRCIDFCMIRVCLLDRRIRSFYTANQLVEFTSLKYIAIWHYKWPVLDTGGIWICFKGKIDPYIVFANAISPSC